MANVKVYLSDTGGATGLTLFHRVRLSPSGLVLDHTDGVFRAAPANDKVPALEITIANGFPANMPGWYQTSESRMVHANGTQVFEAIDALGVQYAGAGVNEIKDDAAITALSIKIQTDLIVTDGAVENGGRLETIDTLTATNLDAQVSLTALENGGRLETVDTIVSALPTFPADPASETTITALTNIIVNAFGSVFGKIFGRKQ